MTLIDTLKRPGAIRVEFQPILCVRGGPPRLYALEALSRGPRGSNVERPDVLFEYARRKGEESQVDSICIADGCSRDSVRAAVIASIVSLADAIGARPIVEGIEHEDDLEVVTALGVDIVQGFLFAPAMPVSELAKSAYLAS